MKDEIVQCQHQKRSECEKQIKVRERRQILTSRQAGHRRHFERRWMKEKDVC